MFTVKTQGILTPSLLAAFPKAKLTLGVIKKKKLKNNICTAKNDIILFTKVKNEPQHHARAEKEEGRSLIHAEFSSCPCHTCQQRLSSL